MYILYYEPEGATELFEVAPFYGLGLGFGEVEFGVGYLPEIVL